MSKLIVLSIGIIWASLLLISWSSNAQTQQTQGAAIERAIY